DATHALHRYARTVSAIWSEIDVLVTPQSGVLPPRIGTLADDMELLFGIVPFTIPFNITGDPAVSLPMQVTSPAGDTPELPVGVQLVAEQGREDVLFRVASQLEAAQPW